MLTDEEVLQARRDIREFRASRDEVAARLGMRRQVLFNMLKGHTYKHVPEALTDLPRRCLHRRALSDEQVAELRRLYLTRQYSQKKLSEMFGVHQTTVSSTVTGKNYGDLGGSSSGKDRQGKPRRLTPEDVVHIRRMYRTGHVSIDTLKKEYGFSTRESMMKLIRGLSYKELPDAVPMHIRLRRTAYTYSRSMPADVREENRNALLKIISQFGGKQSFAKAVDIKLWHANVSSWLKGVGVPQHYLRRVEFVSGVSAMEIRSDLFPEGVDDGRSFERQW